MGSNGPEVGPTLGFFGYVLAVGGAIAPVIVWTRSFLSDRKKDSTSAAAAIVEGLLKLVNELQEERAALQAERTGLQARIRELEQQLDGRRTARR